MDRIHNQELPELATFADQLVRVEGRMDGDPIIVAEIAATAQKVKGGAVYKT